MDNPVLLSTLVWFDRLLTLSNVSAHWVHCWDPFESTNQSADPLLELL